MLWGLTATHSDTTETHQHDLHELVVCLSDSGTFFIDGTAYDYYPGRTLFIPGGTPHHLTATSTVPAKTLFICIAPSSIKQYLPANATNLIQQVLSKPQASEPSHSVSGDVLEVSAKIQKAIKSTSPLAQELFAALFNQLIVLHCMSCVGNASNHNDDQHNPMEEITQWLQKNFVADISTDSLAAKANMSRSVFSRHFRKHTGMSLMEYCLKLRSNAAATTLATSDLGVTQVAYDAGFSNLSHFHRIFKRHYNMAPGEYRKFLRTQGMQAQQQ